MKLITRDIEKEFTILASEFPVITILGPRQSGKTTFSKMLCDDKQYCSLENPDIREFALSDPRGFLNKYNTGAILDEIQRAPALLSYLQQIVDDGMPNGSFILTGSHQLGLHNKITQSLAGRTGLLTLYPYSLNEIRKSESVTNFDTFDLICKGFYPGIHSRRIRKRTFHRNYIKTYVERDARELINLKDLVLFQKFMKLLAGRIGQLVNYSNLANDIGVSSTTIKHWISILSASFLVYELPPYFANSRKRLVKTSKIYFTDTGVAAFLLGINNKEQLERDPLRGALFENAIIMEVVKALSNNGLNENIYFYRDSNTNEVDLIIDTGELLIPVEIKSSETFSKSFLKGINCFFADYEEKTNNGIVVYNGKYEQKVGDVDVVNYSNLLNTLKMFS